jgi:hypothetical protein
VAKAMAKAPEDRYDSCRDLVRDLEYALNASVDLPAATHAGGRQGGGARHSRSALDDAPPTGDLAPTPAGTAPAALPDDEPHEGSGDAGETVGWVSHPSLPPGAIEPPSWGAAASAHPGAGPVTPAGDVDRAAPEERDDGEGFADEVAAFADLDVDESTGSGDEPGYQDDDYASEDYDADDYGSGGYAPDDDGLEEDDLRPGPGGEGSEPWAEEAAARPVARRRRRTILVVVAAVAVIAVVAVVAFLQFRKEEPFVSFADRDAIVPFTLSHPQSWTERTGPASDVVLSPRSETVGDAFLSDATARWGATRQVLAASPQDAMGVYVYTQASGSDTSIEGLRRTITSLLGQGVIVDLGSTHRQLRVGGADGHEFEGVVSDPQAAGTRLSAMFDVVLPQSGGLALLTFFAAPDDFEANRELFTKIRDSVTFPG